MVAMSDSTLDQALKLAAAGFYVIPIIPGKKRPPMDEWQNHATVDPTTITEWWTTRYTNYGIGIAPRQYKDRWLFVIDIDEHDPSASGHETLHELQEAYGKLPDTIICHSGSGVGHHLYFTAPYEIRNGKTARLGPGIDVRGNGGQVCAPPTIHETGLAYTWDLEYNPDALEPAEAPGWLLALLTPKTETKPVRNENRHVWDEIDDSPAGAYNRDNNWETMLAGDGWTFSHQTNDGIQHWTRPGKTTKAGSSATVGYKNMPILHVFTSSIPWLPEGTYSKFKYFACRDFNGDMSRAAKHLIEQKTDNTQMQAEPADNPWPAPIPLYTIHNTPEFPLHTLPPWAVNHIRQTADNIQTPDDLPATLLLGALATLRLNKTWVNYPRQNWRQPCNLYTAVALPPSAGKSPVKQAIFKPIEDLEKQQLLDNRSARLEAESKRNILDKRRKNLEEEIAKPRTKDPHTRDSIEQELKDTISDLAETEMPPTGMIFVDDTTTEALGEALRETGGAIAIISAEGGIFDRIAGLYSDGKSNMDLYLEGWNGGTYKVNRIRREPIHIPSANITIACTVQPTTLDQIGANSEMQGRGLIARFLLCEPNNNVGTRNRTAQHTIDATITNKYNNEMQHIYYHSHTELTLEGPPSDIYADWDQQLENQLKPGQPLEHLAEWVGKLRASVIRIAALLHHAWGQEDTTISTQTLQDAIDIGNYYLAHAQRIADRWGSNPTIHAARAIQEWATRNQLDEFSIRDLYSANRRRFPSVEDTREPLVLLVERGWLRPLFDGPIQVGRRGQESPKFATHPLIHNPQPVDNPSHARHARTQPRDEMVEPVDNYPHARHEYRVACAREENSAMREVPRGNSKDLPIYLENSPHTHTDPCAHETQLVQSGIESEKDTIQHILTLLEDD